MSEIENDWKSIQTELNQFEVKQNLKKRFHNKNKNLYSFVDLRPNTKTM